MTFATARQDNDAEPDDNLAVSRIPGTEPGEERETIPTAGLALRGADGGVSVLVCADFECSYCKQAADTMRQLLEMRTDVGVRLLHNPLPFHTHARLKARASLAAHRQGEFWPMADALFELGETSEKGLVDLARELGLDPTRFAEDLADPAIEAEVARQQELCLDHAATATPTYFIDGRRIVGARPLDQLIRVIDGDEE